MKSALLTIIELLASGNYDGRICTCSSDTTLKLHKLFLFFSCLFNSAYSTINDTQLRIQDVCKTGSTCK